MLRIEKPKFLAVLFICSMLLSLTAFTAHASLWEVQKDISLYGTLNQNLIPDIGNMACGPTSAINSFAYLENAYPEIYGDTLIPGDNSDPVNLIAAATTLAGSTYMDTTSTGTFWDRFIYGKWQYIEDRAPGSTIYNAQVWNTWNWGIAAPGSAPAWVDYQNPTWQFIYEQLLACEDVEILLNYADWGHFLTLTSFHFDDLDNDGIIDVNETAWVDYIDPWTGAWGKSDISGGSGFLTIDYSSTEPQEAWITMVVSESPVPEPSTLILLGIGLLGFAGYGRKKKGSRSA